MTRVTAALVAVLALPLLASCASSFQMNRSGLVPAAEGSVEAKLGENRNVELQIVVDHLAPPGRIAPGAKVYVAWATPTKDGAVSQNLGAIRLDGKLKGKLKTVSPHRDFTLTITPEASPTAPAPTGPVVLERRIEVD